LNNPILLSLVQNAALLMLIVYLYEVAFSRLRLQKIHGARLIIGVSLGLVGIAIMSSPLYVADGLFFDARTVLTGVSGLFFGWLPTVITMLMTAAYRFYLGGAGAWGGAGTAILAGCLGLLWRRWRRDARQRIGFRELYLFGLAANGLSLLLLILVLGPSSERVQILLSSVALPFILTLPAATALLGMLIGDRIETQLQATAITQSEAHFQALYQYAPVALWKEDRSELFKAVQAIRASGHQDIAAYLRERPGEIWRLLSLIRLLNVNEAALALAGAKSLEDMQGSIDGFFDESTISHFVDQLVLMADGQCHYQGERRPLTSLWSAPLISPNTSNTKSRFVKATSCWPI
jgi:PAS domain-containing protein